MTAATTLDLDLVSDFVCPWCFIGKTRLERALADLQAVRPDIEVHVRWWPFLLNPDTPPEGEPYRAFLEAKFGGPRKVDEILARIADAARPDGLAFAFERIRTRPNTFNAHRLCHRAQTSGQTPAQLRALAGALFAAHFQEGRDVGDSQTLADIAAACGDDRDAVLDYLNSPRDVAEVAALVREVGRQGIGGVPFFVIDRRLAVSGAQPAAVLVEALLQAASPERPA